LRDRRSGGGGGISQSDCNGALAREPIFSESSSGLRWNGRSVALEDVLCAGALCNQLTKVKGDCHLDDGALLACGAYREAANNLLAVVSASKNGRRLSANPELRDDVAFCLRRDVYDLVGVRGEGGTIRSVRI
jgi:phosphosulfolactate phosphohydrolase-like enzyme